MFCRGYKCLVSPMVHSLFTQNFDNALVPTGPSKFIITEGGEIITTENGVGLTTED